MTAADGRLARELLVDAIAASDNAEMAAEVTIRCLMRACAMSRDVADREAGAAVNQLWAAVKDREKPP